MSHFFTFAMFGAMLAVVLSLLAGVAGMAKGNKFSQKYANRLMRARILFQAAALGFFVLAVITAKF